METNKSQTGIVIALILIIIVGVGGYMLGRQTAPEPQTGASGDQSATTTPNNQVVAATSTLPTKAEVKSWKTYTYAGIVYKYPADWKANAISYFTPAGQGGQVGVVFSPADVDIKTETERRIDVGGRQADCDVMGEEYVCRKIGPEQMPVYTKSKDPKILLVYGALVNNAVVLNEFGWQTYTSTSGNYQINHPKELVIRSNGSYPPVPGSTVKGTVFEFPASYYQGGTVSSIKAGIVATKASCSVMADGTPWRGEGETATESGLVFDVRKMTDAAAGNYYITNEYSMVRDGLCYRIGLLIHGTNPGNTYTDRATIDSMTELNNKIQANVENILKDMVSTFAITK